MSIKLMTLVWDVPGLTASERLVLLKLADYASDNGENVRPKKETLAKASGVDVRTTQRACKHFEKIGLLVAVEQTVNKRTIYVLDVEVLRKLSADEELPTPAECHPGEMSPRQDVTPDPGKVSPLPRQDVTPLLIRTEPPIDPSVEPPDARDPDPRNTIEAAEAFVTEFWPVYKPLNAEGKNYARVRFIELVASGEATKEFLVQQARDFAEFCKTQKKPPGKALFWLQGGDWEIDWKSRSEDGGIGGMAQVMAGAFDE